MSCVQYTTVYPYGEKWDPVYLQGVLSSMVLSQIYGCEMAACTITSDNIATDAIIARTIAACAVTSPKISANSIIADHIQTDAITAVKVCAGSITTTKLAAGAVTADKVCVTNLGAICANTGCLTVSNYVQSSGFVSGALGTGFCISCTGEAEFLDIYARGKFSTTVFEYDTVSSVGGTLLIAHDADILDAAMTAADASCMTLSGAVDFSEGDILRIRAGSCEEWLCVSIALGSNVYCMVRDLAATYAANNNPAWPKGTAVTNYGLSGDGGLIMSASDSNAPHLDVYTHAGSPWSTICTRMRMGNLNGFLGYGSDAYGIAIGDTNSYLTYDPTNGLRVQGKICVKGANMGLFGYDVDDALVVSLTCSGFCMIDPADACNYSFLSAGALKFHDKLGDVPYVKRIGSGNVGTGCTVELLGWTVSPQVIVSVKELQAYSCTQAQSQRWCIYNDAPECFITSATCYGYCFVVHATLVLEASTGAECTRDAAYGACMTSAACTCAICVRSLFQLWCNAACGLYNYGTECYAVCYRKNGDTAWCACCFAYSQPHASELELKATNSHCTAVVFPCLETWDIMVCEACLTWTATDISSATITCCCVTCNASNGGVDVFVQTGNPGSCTQAACSTFTADPGNVYCSCLVYSACGQVYVTFTSGNCAIACVCVTGPACEITSSASNAEFGPVTVCSYTNAYRTCVAYHAYGWIACDARDSCARVCVYTISQIVCYCSISGAAGCCVSCAICSTRDTYGAYCTIDPAGTLNWLAIAYS